MSQNLKIGDIQLKRDDLVCIVSRLFEDSELSYYNVAKYLQPNFMKRMHDISLLAPPIGFQKTNRYISLPAMEDEIVDFVFRIVL